MNLFDIDYKIETDKIRDDIQRWDVNSIEIKSNNGIIKLPKFSSELSDATDDYYRHTSLFPNNTLLWSYEDIALNKKSIIKEFRELLDDTSTLERDVLRFINGKRYYEIIASVMCQYRFGHHDRYLFKEFPLGNSYKADYLIIGKSSDGYGFIFVELENVYGNITIKDGNLGETFRKGIRQVNDWKSWLEGNFSNLSEVFRKQKGKYEELPKEFLDYDSTRINYIVIAGRRNDFTDKTYRIRRGNEAQSIRLLHYDNLFDFYGKR